MSKVNTAILTLTLMLSIISTVYLYSATPAQAQFAQPEASKGKLATGPGVFRCPGTDCGDLASWYTTFEGVLAVPNEAPLYPYYHGDVEISVSRYGENINPFAQSAQTIAGSPVMGVGFQYMDKNGQPYDPIRNANVNINEVVDGWKLVITYDSAQTNSFRTIWAYALFSDFIEAGSPPNENVPTNDCPNVMDGWILCPYNTPMPASNIMTPHGGRKTNGFVQTAPTPIVLVDTPRRIVVASINTIYDPISGTPGDTSVPVARLTLTFDFNKDTKELIIIKDVKLLLDSKTTNTLTEYQCENPTTPNTIAGLDYVPRFPTAKSQGDGRACIELLDTEQLDLTTAADVSGYAHFYDYYTEPDHNVPETAKCLTTDVDTSATKNLAGGALGDNLPLYQWDTNRGPNSPCYYDIMQAVDQPATAPAVNHIVKKAFWPIPDWFTVDAKSHGQFFTKLEGTTTTDLLAPPDIVGTSVQWNFILNLTPPNPANPSLDARIQWRSVETLYVSDLNDGKVCEAPGSLGGGTTTSTVYSTISQVSPTSPVTETSVEELSSYVVSGTTTYEVIRTTSTAGQCFTTGSNILDKEAMYQDNMVFNPWDIPQAMAKQFSTYVNYFVATSTTPSTQTFSTYAPYDYPSQDVEVGEPLTFIDVPSDTATCTGTFWAPTVLSGGNACWDSYGSFAERVLVVSATGSAMSKTGVPPVPGTDIGGQDVGTLLTRDATTKGYTLTGCTDPVAAPGYDANSCTGFTTTDKYPAGTIFKIIFSRRTSVESGSFGDPYIHSSYEWVTVGRNSAPADSAGAAMVTEALATSSPAVDTLLPGLDMADQGQFPGSTTTSNVNPTLPFVLTRYGFVNSPSITSDYTECNAAPTGLGSFLGACPEGPRFHLRDDFSSVVPIDGGNILAVGGPNANKVADLANDYLSVVYLAGTTNLYASGAWDALSTTGLVFSPAQQECTAATTTNPNLPAGACVFSVLNHAVLATYMDVDGTVFFVLYGGNAQDTFWASQYMLQYVTEIGLQGGPGFKNAETNGGVYCSWESTPPPAGTPLPQVCGNSVYVSGTPYVTTGPQVYAGTTAVIFYIDYSNPHPPSITIFKELDTFSEVFPQQDA